MSDSNLIWHAMNELHAAKLINDAGKSTDEYEQAICDSVLELIDVFSKQGHSGFSAPMVIELFTKLAMFEPLVPLTGEDWEWVNICDERTGGVSVWQNKRCSAVFKQSDRYDGKPYYIDGKVFWSWETSDVDGKPYKLSYTNIDSHVIIQFPYSPKTEYVFVPTEEFPNETI